MKKKAFRALSLFLVVLTLAGTLSIPAFAYSYPMDYTITYKTTDGSVLGTKTGQVDAAADIRNALSITSPSYSGYILSDSNDAVVTSSMITWNFPASNYVRHGTGSYTVYYEKAYSMTVRYLYGSSMRTAAASKSSTGKSGSRYYFTSPTVTGYSPNKTSVSGRYDSANGYDTVYYYENSYTISFNANGGSGAPSSMTKMHFTPLTLPTTKPTRTGYSFMGWATDSSASSVAYLAGGTYSENGDATLYAVWSPNTYTVRYNANGGSGAPSVQTKIYGKTLTLSSTVPTRSGYTFIGWGLSGSSTYASYQPGDSYSNNASRTFYAVWEKNPPATYTVAYNANGGSGAPTSQTKTEDVALSLSSTKPTRSGYTFLGWGLSPTSTSSSYQPGGSYTSNSSVTLYAVWSCNHSSTNTVWDTGCDWRKVCNTCGATVSSGTTHGPYTYGEWEYANTSEHKRTKDCNYGDYSTVEYESHSTTTQYEEYSAVQHMKYSYCADCSSIVGSKSYESHSFVTTYYDGKTVETCSLCGYSKTTLDTYTVTYNANGGSGSPSNQTKVHGVTLKLSTVQPTRFNYAFVGWATSSSASTAEYTAGSNYTDNESVTLYAVWRYDPATYTVSFDANGGNVAPASLTKTYGITMTLPTSTPTRRNYSFVGWSKDRNATSATYSAGGSFTENADVTLYAVWRYSPETYTVSYDANGGSNAPTSQTKTYGVSLTLSTQSPVKSGYAFLGWATSKSATAPEYAPGDSYTEDTGATLYAVWKYIPKTYTVSYNANGGVGAPTNQVKTENVTLKLSTAVPTREGYTFKGWATSSTASSSGYQPGASYTANANLTLYAVWEINHYTVTYNANGGTNAPASQTKTHGQGLTLTTVIPSRSNYAFLGWATESNATSVTYESGAVYNADADITLYAVWQERNYDFSVSDLTVSPEEVKQYGKVTVKFRLDSWDKNLPYENIPVEVLLNGVVIYAETVDFAAYGIQNIVFTLNVGALEGTQTLVARVNWADHESETRAGNNYTATTFRVNKIVETSVESMSLSGEYTEGTQVITSFYAVNEGASDILPEDDVSFEFLVYTLENGTVKTVSQQTWSNVVIPANGRNLVYFKWSVPADSAGTTYYCKGTVNHAYADKEQNTGNNVTEFAVVVQGKASSQTPNTRFEKNPPAGYSANVNPPTTKEGSATWNMWVYESGNLVLKSYGVTVTSANPVVAPSSACKTAEKVSETWNMKSGYGITLNWNPAMVAKSGYTMPGSDAYTNAQNVYATFPEFSYSFSNEKYRTLESVGGVYQFIANSDADKNERIHFIPVYVEDGNYTVSVTATQIWTPAGMISATRSANTIVIDGTMYDDLYVGER